MELNISVSTTISSRHPVLISSQQTEWQEWTVFELLVSVLHRNKAKLSY
jgi:hypothetical protein